MAPKYDFQFFSETGNDAKRLENTFSRCAYSRPDSTCWHFYDFCNFWLEKLRISHRLRVHMERDFEKKHQNQSPNAFIPSSASHRIFCVGLGRPISTAFRRLPQIVRGPTKIFCLCRILGAQQAVNCHASHRPSDPKSTVCVYFRPDRAKSMLSIHRTPVIGLPADQDETLAFSHTNTVFGRLWSLWGIFCHRDSYTHVPQAAAAVQTPNRWLYGRCAFASCIGGLTTQPRDIEKYCLETIDMSRDETFHYWATYSVSTDMFSGWPICHSWWQLCIGHRAYSVFHHFELNNNVL